MARNIYTLIDYLNSVEVIKPCKYNFLAKSYQYTECKLCYNILTYIKHNIYFKVLLILIKAFRD